ncbi:hypothetical protein PF005_g14320 [Phytophthora fragariae]|uniref:Uncharacterized protein n=1 Tax=Phytophthora fragariae TaxID=53985 RepID=A0A6A3XIE7_9STRA|nr:hypothetical protein PF003_g13288 [Phytophthora fragariae]KAE9006849.1 hypothetical protein PF011_g11396 [Phytophthora fragariae]KAE9102737.1 hypothetical protein PF010_g14005 [Phytophthora fragariae]KAE9102758.1 hypothetical protein PF007_g14646 [Phytophthora fragariae]KAE9140251.1 hypothetical protein PF006_g13573 [Phytophthora fragariae]
MNTTARLYNSERDVWTTKRANLFSLASTSRHHIAGNGRCIVGKAKRRLPLRQPDVALLVTATPALASRV